MLDWDNFERYAILAGGIIVAILIIILLVAWYRKSSLSNQLFYVPPAPGLVQRPPNITNQPFTGPNNNINNNNNNPLVNKNNPQLPANSVVVSKPNAYPGNISKYGKNPIVIEENIKIKKLKKRRNSSSSSSSSSDDSNNTNQPLTIEVYFWGATYCKFSEHFYHVWRNVTKRFKKHKNNGVKIIFKQRLCDKRDINEFKNTLVDGHPITQFPTVSVCLPGKAHQLITDHAINEEDLEHRINDFIYIKKLEVNNIPN